VAPGTRLVAVETNATKRPLPERAGLEASPVAPVATVEMAVIVPGMIVSGSSAVSVSTPISSPVSSPVSSPASSSTGGVRSQT